MPKASYTYRPFFIGLLILLVFNSAFAKTKVFTLLLPHQNTKIEAKLKNNEAENTTTPLSVYETAQEALLPLANPALVSDFKLLLILAFPAEAPKIQYFELPIFRLPYWLKVFNNIIAINAP